jgi:N-acetylglutamate synthase-like GNAT family acetyltransferase
MEIRKAREKDADKIKALLKALEMDYPIDSYDSFMVAVIGEEIAGLANVEEFDDFLFFSSFGVKPNHRNVGIASALLNDILTSARKNIYLYTTIPDFFRNFGFEDAPMLPNLPKKEKFSCQECDTSMCVCMIRKISGS